MMIFDYLLVTMCSCCFQYPTRSMFSLCISTENAVKVQKNDPFTSGHQLSVKKKKILDCFWLNSTLASPRFQAALQRWVCAVHKCICLWISRRRKQARPRVDVIILDQTLLPFILFNVLRCHEQRIRDKRNYTHLLFSLDLPCDLDIVPCVFLHGDVRGDGIQIVTICVIHCDPHLSAVSGQAEGCLGDRMKSCNCHFSVVHYQLR